MQSQPSVNQHKQFRFEVTSLHKTLTLSAKTALNQLNCWRTLIEFYVSLRII